MAGTRCGRKGLEAAELEFELGDVGDSERLLLSSGLLLTLLLLLLLWLCTVREPKMLSMLNIEAAAAAVAVTAAAEPTLESLKVKRSSSIMVAPDWEPSSEEGVWDCVNWWWCCCFWLVVWFICWVYSFVFSFFL